MEKTEKKFIEKMEIGNFVSNIDFCISDTDTNRPDLMFCRIGLFLTADSQVAVSIEGDYRLFRNYLKQPADTPVKTLLTLCRALSMQERMTMVNALPAMADRHEKSYQNVLT